MRGERFTPVGIYVLKQYLCREREREREGEVLCMYYENVTFKRKSSNLKYKYEIVN